MHLCRQVAVSIQAFVLQAQGLYDYEEVKTTSQSKTFSVSGNRTIIKGSLLDVNSLLISASILVNALIA